MAYRDFSKISIKHVAIFLIVVGIGTLIFRGIYYFFGIKLEPKPTIGALLMVWVLFVIVRRWVNSLLGKKTSLSLSEEKKITEEIISLESYLESVGGTKQLEYFMVKYKLSSYEQLHYLRELKKEMSENAT